MLVHGLSLIVREISRILRMGPPGERWRLLRSYLALRLRKESTRLLKLTRLTVHHPAVIDIVGFKVRINDYGLALALFNDLFVQGPYNFDSDSSAPVILDCGAHLGFATLYFKWRFPQASVDAFEPDPDLCRLLRETVRANGLADVRVHELALGSAPGTAEFYSDNDYGAGVANSLRRENLGEEASPAPLPVSAAQLSDYVGSEWTS